MGPDFSITLIAFNIFLKSHYNIVYFIMFMTIQDTGLAPISDVMFQLILIDK